MKQAIHNYLFFLWRCARIAFVGDWRYYAWMGLLSVFILLGLNAYAKQFVHGLIVTGMSDEVSWGVYIANFTFLVGVAAAAVMMVIPVYIYNNEEMHDLVIFGELLAVAAIRSANVCRDGARSSSAGSISGSETSAGGRPQRFPTSSAARPANASASIVSSTFVRLLA